LVTNVPFIVVSGKIGEDAAVEIMKAGANDYLTKENMSRLCPAIECELREAEVRRERERAEKALGLSEDRFRHLVEQIPAVTYVQEPIDSDTPKTITYMSPQYEAMLGYPPEKEVLEEDHWLRVLHPDDRERVLAEELRTDETGEPYRIEYRQIARGGRVVWVRGEATLVRNEEGNSLYCLGVQYDITEQKQTEEFRESEERFRTTFEQAAVGIVQVGLDGEWLRFNDKFCDIVGYEREELSAMSVFQLISPDGFERLRQGRQVTGGGVQELIPRRSSSSARAGGVSGST
jgi:sigma-B regulation protein RsbU (phosphoserine phosphatase)